MAAIRDSARGPRPRGQRPAPIVPFHQFLGERAASVTAEAGSAGNAGFSFPLAAGAMHGASQDGNVCAFHRDAQEIASGIGVGHRVGVVDVEDQGKVERVGAGGQGFVQDAVAADVFEGDAAQLVLVEVVGGDGARAQCASRDDRQIAHAPHST